MIITLTITVDVKHQSGKFATKEELAQLLIDEVEAADPSELTTDEDATYAVMGFSAEWAS